MKWIGLGNLILINDEYFVTARVLAPESKADFAFILHALSYISVDGHVEIAPLSGIYRGGTKQKFVNI